MKEPISNLDDIIDSRDVIARIEELESEIEDGEESGQDVEDEKEELAELKALAEQGEGYGDWAHGETLIRESYFVEYAEQLADDIGAVNRESSWPNNHIDWEAAAAELKIDYMSLDFGGTEYWMRA